MFFLPQYGIYLPTFFFVQAILTLLIIVYKTISIEYSFQQGKTIFSAIAPCFFNIFTAETVGDLNDAPTKKQAVFFQMFLVNQY